ncbi:hypothetical protein [Candidatus Gullanella endobia]
MSNNWQRTSTVLAACQLKNNSVWVQAILNNNLTRNDILHVRYDSTIYYL